jgi:spermidine/putrescine transport system substrate-binding protein
MKKFIALLIIVVMLGTMFIGCSPKDEPVEPADTEEPVEPAEEPNEEMKTLTVLNWKGYGSDADYSAKVFEEMYNCKVEHVYFTSLEEMLTMLRTGGLGTIDVLLPNSNVLLQAWQEGLIQPVDTSKMENYMLLKEDLRNFDDAIDAEGNVYGVPWAWGTTSLGYNTDVIEEEITSWASLWDDKYAGKVAYFDDYNTAILTAALYLQEEDPYNPDLEKVQAALIELKENTRTYWSSYDDYLKPFAAGEIVIGNMWTGLASTLYRNGDPINYVYPVEGAVGWSDFWAIATDAPNPDLAHKWLDFMSGEQFQTDFANDPYGAIPSNTDALSALTDDLKKAFFIYPEAPTNLVMQASQDEETKQAWLEVWNNVKSH